jgi:hypothetical protein
VPPYVGHRGWLGPGSNWDELAGMIEDAMPKSRGEARRGRAALRTGSKPLRAHAERPRPGTRTRTCPSCRRSRNRFITPPSAPPRADPPAERRRRKRRPKRHRNRRRERPARASVRHRPATRQATRQPPTRARSLPPAGWTQAPTGDTKPPRIGRPNGRDQGRRPVSPIRDEQGRLVGRPGMTPLSPESPIRQACGTCNPPSLERIGDELRRQRYERHGGELDPARADE